MTVPGDDDRFLVDVGFGGQTFGIDLAGLGERADVEARVAAVLDS